VEVEPGRSGTRPKLAFGPQGSPSAARWRLIPVPGDLEATVPAENRPSPVRFQDLTLGEVVRAEWRASATPPAARRQRQTGLRTNRKAQLGDPWAGAIVLRVNARTLRLCRRRLPVQGSSQSARLPGGRSGGAREGHGAAQAVPIDRPERCSQPFGMCREAIHPASRKARGKRGPRMAGVVSSRDEVAEDGTFSAHQATRPSTTIPAMSSTHPSSPPFGPATPGPEDQCHGPGDRNPPPGPTFAARRHVPRPTGAKPERRRRKFASCATCQVGRSPDGGPSNCQERPLDAAELRPITVGAELMPGVCFSRRTQRRWVLGKGKRTEGPQRQREEEGRIKITKTTRKNVPIFRAFVVLWRIWPSGPLGPFSLCRF